VSTCRGANPDPPRRSCTPQGCLRPGCVELVLDALLSSGTAGSDWATAEAAAATALLCGGDAAAAAEALAAALPEALRGRELVLQVRDEGRRACPPHEPASAKPNPESV
jgi:hypothetical protein